MISVQIVEVPERAAFKIAAAAKYLGMSLNALRYKTDLGLIEARRDDGNRRVYLLRDLDAYLNSLPRDKANVSPFRNRPTRTGRYRKGDTHE